MSHYYQGKHIERFIALDPGGTTGVTKYWLEDHSTWSIQLEGDHYLNLEDMLLTSLPQVIVCERFDYRPKQKTADLSPVEYIGVVKLAATKLDVPVVMQGQIKGEKGKGFWDNEKLKAINMYLDGDRPHANDSIRQALHFVTFELNDLYWVEKLND